MGRGGGECNTSQIKQCQHRWSAGPSRFLCCWPDKSGGCQFATPMLVESGLLAPSVLRSPYMLSRSCCSDLKPCFTQVCSLSSQAVLPYWPSFLFCRHRDTSPTFSFEEPKSSFLCLEGPLFECDPYFLLSSLCAAPERCRRSVVVQKTKTDFNQTVQF